MQTWLITGANGNLGKRLVTDLLADPQRRVVAVVRSESARQAVENLSLDDNARSRLLVKVLDYADMDALHQAAKQADKAIHLVGILKQTSAATYAEAHEASSRALVAALVDTHVDHLTYLSIVGSSDTALNACLASKGRAEVNCIKSLIDTCILRVPMVLGEGDYASHALHARALKRTSFTFRAASKEQPIYAGDVVRAMVAAGTLNVNATLELGGPETLSRRALTKRAATILGVRGRVISLPKSLGRAVAATMELVLANPPMTRTMLDVLDHDDDVDSSAALDALHLAGLTSLDDTLRAVLA